MSTRGLINQRWDREAKNRDRHAERFTVLCDHFVMTFHCTQRRFKNSTAGIVKFTTGQNEGLLTHHTFTLNFSPTSITVGYQPVTAEQLHVETPHIAYGNRVSEDKTLFIRYRL